MSDLLYKIDVTQALAALDQIGAADAKLRAAAEQTGQAQKQSFTEAARAAQDYQQRLATAQGEVRRAGEVYNELKAVLGASAREAAALEKSLKASGNAATEAGQRIKADLTANRAKQAELRVEIDLTRKAIDEERAAVARVRQEQQQQVGQQKLVTAAAKDTAAAQKQAAGAAKEAGGSGEGFFGGLLGKLGPLAAGLVTVNKLLGAITQGIDDYASISGIQNTFKTLTGSAQAGAQEFAFIRAEANRFGLELAPIARSYASLFAAAKEANLPLEQTRAIFQGVTAAGKTFNLTSAETEQALRAVQQMLSKGTVASQELKLQLGNVLPGAFALAAKAAGLTTVELTKQLEQGKIIASDFLPKFAKQLQLTYGAGTEDAANSVRSNMGRINTFFQEQSARIGALVTPLIASFASIVAAEETAAQKSDRLVLAYQKQNGAVAELRSTVAPLVSRYEELASQTTRNATQQKELDDIMQQLAKSVPGAVTEFDAYGKALGINSKAVRQFIEDQENLVRYNNKSRLKENSAALEELVAERNRVKNQLNSPTNVEVDGLTRRTVAVANTRYRETLSQADSDAITARLTAQLEGIQKDIKANLDNRQILRGKSLLVPKLDDAAEAAGLQGLIEKQKKVIEQIQKRQASAVREVADAAGGDFLLGKGGLNQQLEAAQKELDRLLGKVDKAAKKPKGPDYLKQLLAEEERLRKEAAKKELDLLKDNGEARAQEQYQQALDEVQRTEAKLKKLEKLAGRDGKIDGVQAAALAQLRAAAADAYLAELQRIALAYNDKLFALREESTQKELLAIERKYDREAQAARGQTQLLLAIEEARARELQAVRQRQQQEQIDEQARAGQQAAARIGDIYGAGTGRSVIEAKRDEKRQLLEVEKQAAQASLENTLLLNSKEGAAQREALQQRLREITRALDEVDKEKASHKVEDFIYGLILGEKDSPEARAALDSAVKDSLGAVSQLLAAQQQLTQAKIDERSRNIDDLNTRLSQEIALNKEGAASNIGNLREEIKAEKEARREAIKEKRQAAREQILIDTLLQSSSVITAAANALSAFPIPFVGPFLGITAAGAIVSAFVTSKVKAYQAAGKADAGFFKGGYTGDDHERRESRQLGDRSYTYHHKEFVHDHEVTARYRHALLEPLHQRNPRLIDWDAPAMRELLPDFTLPARIQAERQQAAEVRVTHQFAPMQQQFDAMQRELSAIRQHTGTSAGRPDVVPTDTGYMIIDPATKSTHTVRLRKAGE